MVERVAAISDGRVTSAETLNRIMINAATAWIAYDEETLEIVGFFTTRVDDYPGTKLLTGEVMGGTHFMEWAHACHDALVVWAKYNKCKGIQLIGRKGWDRYLNHEFGWTTKFITTQLLFEEEDIDGQTE